MQCRQLTCKIFLLVLSSLPQKSQSKCCIVQYSKVRTSIHIHMGQNLVLVKELHTAYISLHTFLIFEVCSRNTSSSPPYLNYHRWHTLQNIQSKRHSQILKTEGNIFHTGTWIQIPLKSAAIHLHIVEYKCAIHQQSFYYILVISVIHPVLEQIWWTMLWRGLSPP